MSPTTRPCPRPASLLPAQRAPRSLRRRRAGEPPRASPARRAAPAPAHTRATPGRRAHARSRRSDRRARDGRRCRARARRGGGGRESARSVPRIPYCPLPAQLTEIDVAVIGAGAAGLYAALVAAEYGARVLL